MFQAANVHTFQQIEQGMVGKDVSIPPVSINLWGVVHPVTRMSGTSWSMGNFRAPSTKLSEYQWDLEVEATHSHGGSVQRATRVTVAFIA
jgi:hypothetical protein